MRPLAIALLASTLTIASSRPAHAGGASPAGRADDPEAGRKLDDLLARWEARNRGLRSLSIKFQCVDESRLVRTKHTSAGQLHIQGPDRLYVDDYEVKDGGARGRFLGRMVLDGGDFYHFVGLTRKVFLFRREPGSAGQVLESGPLAFIFGIDAAKLRERFEIEILRETADSYTLRAIPKRPEDRREFGRALVKLDKARLLPVAIRLTMPGGPSETKTYTCSLPDVEENPTIEPSRFDAPAMAETLRRQEGWSIVDSGAWTAVAGSLLPPKAPATK